MAEDKTMTDYLRDLNEAARYYLGPHAYAGLQSVGQLANFFGPQADVVGAVESSQATMESAREGDIPGTLTNAAYTAMSPLGLLIPGTVQGYRSTVQDALATGAGKGLSGLLPERWYRGTNNLNELDYRFAQGKEGVLGGGGVYLTPDPTFASRYAEASVFGEPKVGGFVLPLTAKFDKPLIVELSKEKGEYAEGRVLQELLGISQEKAYDKAEKALDRKGSLTNEVKQKAIQQGYDGVVLVRDGKVLEAISYRPEDIRSVFGEGTQALDDIVHNLNFTPAIDYVIKPVEYRHGGSVVSRDPYRRQPRTI